MVTKTPRAAGIAAGPARPARSFAIGGAAALLILAAGCGTKSEPEVSVFSGGIRTDVHPALFCEEDLSDCPEGEYNVDPGAYVGIPVDSAGVVQISLPKDVAGADWMLQSTYAGGTVEESFGAGDHAAVTVPGTTDRGPLMRIVISKPSIRVGTDQELLASAQWVINTDTFGAAAESFLASVAQSGINLPEECGQDAYVAFLNANQDPQAALPVIFQVCGLDANGQ